MRRAVQLGQIPRRLQLNATTISSWQVWQRTRVKPCARDAAPQIRSELTLDVARQPAAVGVGVAQLGEQRLGVPGHQLVQHGSFRGPAPVPAERLSGRAGRPFVQAADEHVSAF